jgi:predicted amino acid dehydrogenase
MVIKERTVDSSLKTGEIEGSNSEKVFSILRKYQGRIPQDVWDTSLSRIHKAFEEFESPAEKLKGTATSAFFVHTRRNGELDQIDDSARYLPILKPNYGIPEDEIEEILNFLPPLKIGEVKGVLNGKEINCAIISIPITPKALNSFERQSEKLNYVRPRIYQAAELAKKMGAGIIGLGETLASSTKHGEKLQEKVPEIKVTTGHAFTTYFMNEWAKFAAKDLGTKLSKSCVTIIGANGSIGSSITEVLLEEGVGGLRLHDKNKEDVVGVLRNRADKIMREYPELDGKVSVTFGDENLNKACEGSEIVLVAASAPKPFIESKHLNYNSRIVDDSQPSSILPEEAQKAGSTILWVVGALPEGLVSTFNSGLVGKAEWTCLLEVLALEALGKDALETVGRVTPERVKQAGEMARTLGINLPVPQSWGTPQISLQ